VIDRANCKIQAAMSFIEELKRRNVIKVAIAYVIVAWLLLQVADVVLPTFDSPVWVMQAFTFLLILSFPLALLFAWAFELTPEGVKREKNVDPAESIAHITGRKLDFVIIAVLVLAVVTLVVDRYSALPTSVSQQVVEKSIAVLPFVNMSDDADNEYFSDGISEEILNSLAKVKDLKVAGRTSSFAFKGRNEDLRTIGEALGVSHILEGSVRKAGTKVRITAQLVQADDGYHLWSETYDRELTDIFAIQDEIATEILDQLKAQLLDNERQGLVSQRTDSEVYDLYLLARQRLAGRTPQFIESAVELLDQAIAKDPAYAPAYAQRGIAEMFLADDSYGTIPRAEAYAQGKRYVDTALELNPQLAEAWAGLGLYHINQPVEFEQASIALEKALSINPNLIDASNWLHIALQNSGEPRAALQLLVEMTQRDPLYLPGFTNAVRIFNNFGEEGKAQALIDHYRKFDPNNLHLLHIDAQHHMYNGRPAEGFRLAERSLAGGPSDLNTQLAFSQALLQTLQIERVAEEGYGEFKVVALELSGRRDEAFELAYDLTEYSDMEALFWLFNRADRSRELIAYVEERWFSLDLLAADYRFDVEGYSLMTNVALAYSNVGNTSRFDESLLLVQDAMSFLSDEGIDNWKFMYNNAEYLALAGRYDEAMTQLEYAVDRGMLMCVPITRFSTLLEPLRDDPRLAAAEAIMTENIIAEREALDLDAIDPVGLCWN
jgi:TolB-like protein/Tfp pilus assembly protein PilF